MNIPDLDHPELDNPRVACRIIEAIRYGIAYASDGRGGDPSGMIAEDVRQILASQGNPKCPG